MRALSPIRLGFLALVGSALFIVIGARLAYLQLYQHQELQRRALRQQEKEFTLAAPRGSLVDRRGVVLARNGDSVSVYGVPSEVEDVTTAARGLSRLLKLPARKLRRKLSTKRSFVWLARQRPIDLRERLETLDLKGVYWQTESRRYYPRGDAFQSALGFAGIDNNGLEGLEFHYEKVLAGSSGKFLRRIDGRRRPVEGRDRILRPPRQGADLLLTVDEVIQHITYSALKNGVERCGARGGIVVVADPSSGEILAMADYGHLAPKGGKGAGGRQYRAHGVTWQFEPGSIFKPAVVAVAIDRGIYRPNDLIFAENGSYQVADRVFHEASGHKFAWMSIAQVLQRSSNIGMVKVVERLRPKDIYRYLRDFGFGEKTGIDYPGEATGRLRTPKEWSLVSPASIAIGQEVAVTPLQMVTLYNAFANGGMKVTPSLGKAIREPAGGRRQLSQRHAPRRVIPRAVAGQITRMLKGVVGPKGTAEKAAVEGFAVAGKTGTAQKFDRRAGCYSRTRYVSSFIGYLPADNPRLTILVTLDEPRGGAYGGQVAAPIFREIATKSLRYLGVRAEPGPRILNAAVPRGMPRLTSLTL